MIDKNNGCVTRSKLTITVKTVSKGNDRSRVVAQTNKQTNRLRGTVTDKHLGRKHTKGRKRHIYIQIDAQTDLLWTHAHKEFNKK